MAKLKIYTLAEEFKVSSEALVQMLRTMGIAVKSHMSTVDENLRDEIKKKFTEQRAEIKKEYARKKQMLAKKQEDLRVGAEQHKETTLAEAAAVHAQAQAQAQVPASAAPAPAPAPAPVAPPQPLPLGQVQGPVYAQARSSQPPQAPFRFAGPGGAPVGNPGAQGGPRHHASTGRSMSTLTRHDKVFAPDVATVVGSPGTTGATPREDPHKKGKKRGAPSRRTPAERELDQSQLKTNVKKTLARIGAGSARKKYRKDPTKKAEEIDTNQPILKVSEFVTAAELANMIGKAVSEVIAKCLELGLFVTINQRLDFETIELLADEFGYQAKLLDEYAQEEEEDIKVEQVGELKPRAPVVTVMGHVDHGKTSLLDYVRRTNVIAGEAGGITQHIAAYEVLTKQGPVTFLDTPGHEAFTAMRARGAQVTDVIVLVVAGDSGVMPQTKEAIDHARAANVPMVVAINKTDLPTANIDKVKSELAQYNVLVDTYGGNVSCVEISARTGKGIDKLLEVLALETEMLELKASPEGLASGVVIESELDKGRGSVATVLIQRGTLKRGDAFVTGIHYGKVRDLLNERGAIVETAGPSKPAVVLGLSGTPQAGDSFRVVLEEKEAREISARRRLAAKERELRKISTVSLDHLYEQIKAGAVQSINLVIKGDVDGSVEALAESLSKLTNEEIRVNVIHKSVGAVKEADIMLAAASKAIVVGFHLSPNSKIRELARREGVDIRTYRIIYEAVDAVRLAMEGMLAPEIRENPVGSVEIREVFKISKVGIVAGCYVLSGSISRGAKAHVIRDDVEIAETTVASLRRHKDEARDVGASMECGVTLNNFDDYKQGDRIEVYEEIKIARKLAQ
jgi:translation initiation factor IF-2